MKKSNAEITLRKIKQITDRTCEIIFEDGLYKVRISGFKDRTEGRDYLPIVIHAGYKEAFLLEYHKDIAIQVDAFIFRQNALSVHRKLMEATGRKVSIVAEDGFYKVRIHGFSGRKEAEEYLPMLRKGGYPEAFIISETADKLHTKK